MFFSFVVRLIKFKGIRIWGFILTIYHYFFVLVFIIILLTRISGVPMLEKRADEKWGGQPEYEAYKAGTSVLVPMPPKK